MFGFLSRLDKSVRARLRTQRDIPSFPLPAVPLRDNAAIIQPSTAGTWLFGVEIDVASSLDKELDLRKRNEGGLQRVSREATAKNVV